MTSCQAANRTTPCLGAHASMLKRRAINSNRGHVWATPCTLHARTSRRNSLSGTRPKWDKLAQQLDTSCLHRRHTRAAHARNHANAHALRLSGKVQVRHTKLPHFPRPVGPPEKPIAHAPKRSEHRLLSLGATGAGLPLRLTRRADHRTLPQLPFGVDVALLGRTPPTDVRARTHSHT